MSGLRFGLNPFLVPVSGMVTATFGGLTRDTICNLPASKQGNGRILYSELDCYAFPAFAGATVYTVGALAGGPIMASMFAGIGTTFGLRVFVRDRYGLYK